jgi:hypothetical protein
MEFIAFLESSIGRAGRIDALRAFYTVPLVPDESRSLEPMAARIEPAHVRQWQRARQHCTAEASWKASSQATSYRRGVLEGIEPGNIVSPRRPGRQRARQHCTAEASRNDRAVHRAIRQDVLPIIEKTGLIEAGIILETLPAETALRRNSILSTTIRFPS